MKKTGWQLIESVSFGNGNLCLAFRAAKLTISLTHKRVFFETFTAESVKTHYGFWLGKIIQANRTFNMFFEVFQERFHGETKCKADYALWRAISETHPSILLLVDSKNP